MRHISDSASKFDPINISTDDSKLKTPQTSSTGYHLYSEEFHQTSDDEFKAEITADVHIIKSCSRMKTKIGTRSYVVRALTTDQSIIDNLFSKEAFTLSRRQNVETF